MAISQKFPPLHATQCSSGDSSSSAASSSDGESSACSSSTCDSRSDHAAHNEEEVGVAEGGGEHEDEPEETDKEAAVGGARWHLRARPRPTPVSLGVPPACCKGSCAARSVQHGGTATMAHLRRHLASLRSLLPPVARSPQASNVIADALRYKRALAKEIEMLQKALPFAQQVNVKRLGMGCLQVGVSCDKEPGLLVALMEALESFGLIFANVSVSCLNDKIKIEAVSTQDIGERIGSLKVALVATIMRFTPKK